jgi:alpha-D-xyloside xylohydrolase
MKFTDGFWLVRQGVDLAHAHGVRDVEPADGGFTAFAPTKAVQSRGDTLMGPLLTARVWSPAPGVIGVEVSHLAGDVDRGPHFDVQTTGADAWSEPVKVQVEGTQAELTSGDLAARLTGAEGLGLQFVAGGRVLTECGYKGLAVARTAEGTHHMVVQLTLGVGENVYGLGERFTALVKNGQTVDVWNSDGGTSSEQAYKNVPFYLTNGGYGVFVDHAGAVSFEIASESVSRVQFSVPDQKLRFYVIHGPTPRDILRRYTGLTGRPALPPAWSYGTWLSTSFTTSYDEATVTEFIDGMASRQLPLSVFHFDCFWMREYHWCDFEWDPVAFPDPVGMLRRLKDRGLKISLWINPYIAQRSRLFAEGKEKGYLLRRPDGGVWQWDLWQPGMALVDFTNPDACEWYAGHLNRLLDQGVDCFKTDFGERVPTDVVWFDGSDPQRMHNYYTQVYNQIVFKVLQDRFGEDGAVVFARSATAGGQQFPVHWGGDNSSTFPSMAETLRGGLSLALCGFGYWSHDIGGFEGTPDAAVFKRWIPFGMLSSHSRFHGNESYRVPWTFDEEAVDVLRRFTSVKYRLMPSLYGAAREAHREGTPTMRPMLLAFPEDPTTQFLDRQYLLGPDVLVAPVFSAEGEVSYYLPAGRWTDLLTGRRIDGPIWITDHRGFDTVPLLLRPGAVLPVGSREDRPDYDYSDSLTLVVHELADGAVVDVEVPSLAGEVAARFIVRRIGSVISIEPDGRARGWRAVLAGVTNRSCRGCQDCAGWRFVPWRMQQLFEFS